MDAELKAVSLPFKEYLLLSMPSKCYTLLHMFHVSIFHAPFLRIPLNVWP
jgi:hypothetical protein